MVSVWLIMSDVSLCACYAGSLYVSWCKCSVLEMSGGLGNQIVMYNISNIILIAFSGLLCNLAFPCSLVFCCLFTLSNQARKKSCQEAARTLLLFTGPLLPLDMIYLARFELYSLTAHWPLLPLDAISFSSSSNSTLLLFTGLLLPLDTTSF